ncbi:hypothetical protein GCM10009105_12520 [Dokdonella soli]|uniref:Uncharacterized protein n=1 Tax=Dokdonella soli TaxID=529810 RepID=A0ABN1IEJ4_9GAMM
MIAEELGQAVQDVGHGASRKRAQLRGRGLSGSGAGEAKQTALSLKHPSMGLSPVGILPPPQPAEAGFDLTRAG